MDSASLGLSDFSEKDKAELQTFIQNEQQKARFQESGCFLPGPASTTTLNADELRKTDVHSLTAMCWTKCIAPNRISGPQVDKSETACLDNCVNRFIDAQKTVIAQLEGMTR